MVTTKWLLLAGCAITFTIRAQPSQKRIRAIDSIRVDSVKNKSWTIGTDYANRILFWGRDFGERQFGVSPYLMYSLPNGLYAYTQFDFWSATPRRPARHVLGAGYEVQVTNWLALQAGYERWINHYDDSYFDNALKNELEAGLEFRVEKISIEPTFYYFFGLEQIYDLDIAVSRPWQLLNKKLKISIVPQAITTFATPVFSYMFYEFPDPDYNYEKFRLVDFEGNASLVVGWKKFELVATTCYNFPVSIANEVISPFFYCALEINYSF